MIILISFLVSLLQNATGNVTVPTTQTLSPVTTATVDIRSAKSREFVQCGAAVSITVSCALASDLVTSATVDKRSANATVTIIVQCVAASKTARWLSYVVLIATISCFNLLISD